MTNGSSEDEAFSPAWARLIRAVLGEPDGPGDNIPWEDEEDEDERKHEGDRTSPVEGGG